MAENLILKLSALSGKLEDVKKIRNKWVNSIIEYEDAEFESLSRNKSKDDFLAESAVDAEAYEDKAEDCILKNDPAVRKAEALLAEVAPQVQSGNTSEEAKWSAFKPQANLSPILLDTGADHLEVMKFTEAIETYIVTGFRGRVPKYGNT